LDSEDEKLLRMGEEMSYFTLEKKKKAATDLETIHRCAEKAGIREHLWIGFGLVLGIVRDRDFILHDNDVDMCVNADKVTEEQEKAYRSYLREEEMFFARGGSARRKDTDRLTWFTLRKRMNRAKFCHWFGFPWNGYWWWSKGSKWVKEKKFKHKEWQYTGDAEAIMLGTPLAYVENLITVDFYGLKVQIPGKYGSYLDDRYPGWRVPRIGGASAKKIVCVVNKWADQSTWKIKNHY